MPPREKNTIITMNLKKNVKALFTEKQNLEKMNFRLKTFVLLLV